MTPQEEITQPSTHMVVSVLMTGKSLKTRDVAAAVSDKAGREISPAAVGGILSRISDPTRSDLGNFIRKQKRGNAWVYTMTPAILVLTDAQAFSLTQKSGTDRYTLMQALRDYPQLQKEIDAPNFTEGIKPVFRIMRTLADKVRPAGKVEIHARKPHRPAENLIDVSIRYSSTRTLSFVTSLKTFILLCLAAVATMAACCLIVYSFLFHIAVLILAAALGWLGWRMFRVSRRSSFRSSSARSDIFDERGSHDRKL